MSLKVWRWLDVLRIMAATMVLVNVVSFGQTVPSVSQTSAVTLTSNEQSQLAGFKQEQSMLLQQLKELQTEGATPAQIQAWRQQNAATFQDLRQRELALTAEGAIATPAPFQAVIPANATPELTEFLQNQAMLANKYAQLHAENLAAGNRYPVTLDQMARFRQQNAALLKRQQELNQILVKKGEITWQSGFPAQPANSPPNASSQLKAFLTLSYQVNQEENQVRQRYSTADAATQKAALATWVQHHLSELQQLKQLAEALPQPPISNSSAAQSHTP